MKLDSLSKECVTIGCLSLVFSLVLITMEAEEMKRIAESDYSQENRSQIYRDHCRQLVEYVGAALISVLIIVGIRMRCAILMVPWLLAAFAGVTLSILIFVGIAMVFAFGHPWYMFYLIAMIGLESVVLYPMCTLFGDIRRERAHKLREQDRNKNVIVKI